MTPLPGAGGPARPAPSRHRLRPRGRVGLSHPGRPHQGAERPVPRPPDRLRAEPGRALPLRVAALAGARRDHVSAPAAVAPRGARGAGPRLVHELLHGHRRHAARHRHRGGLRGAAVRHRALGPRAARAGRPQQLARRAGRLRRRARGVAAGARGRSSRPRSWPSCRRSPTRSSQTITRELGRTDSGASIAFTSTLVALAVAAVSGLVAGGGGDRGADLHPSIAFLVRGWARPSWGDFGLMVLCGLISASRDVLLHAGLSGGVGEHGGALRVRHDRLVGALGLPVLGRRPGPVDPRRRGGDRDRAASTCCSIRRGPSARAATRPAPPRAEPRRGRPSVARPAARAARVAGAPDMLRCSQSTALARDALPRS